MEITLQKIKPINQNGTSLISVLVAATILAFGSVLFSKLFSSVYHQNQESKEKLLANSYMTELAEYFRSRTLTSLKADATMANHPFCTYIREPLSYISPNSLGETTTATRQYKMRVIDITTLTDKTDCTKTLTSWIPANGERLLFDVQVVWTNAELLSKQVTASVLSDDSSTPPPSGPPPACITSIADFKKQIYTSADIQTALNALGVIPSYKYIYADMFTAQKVCEVVSGGTKPIPQGFGIDSCDGANAAAKSQSGDTILAWDVVGKKWTTFSNNLEISGTKDSGWGHSVMNSLTCREKTAPGEIAPLDSVVVSTDIKGVTFDDLNNYFASHPPAPKKPFCARNIDENPLTCQNNTQMRPTVNIELAQQLCSWVTNGQFPNVYQITGRAVSSCGDDDVEFISNAAWVQSDMCQAASYANYPGGSASGMQIAMLVGVYRGFNHALFSSTDHDLIKCSRTK